MLQVTNGQSGVDALNRAGVEGPIVAWSDVLYEGPVPAGLTHEALTRVRAKFLANKGWETLSGARAKLEYRDRLLRDGLHADYISRSETFFS